MVDDREPDVAIEECVQSRRLYHHTTYHHISPEERSLIQQQLLEWYDREKRTNMPWRKEYRNDLDREVNVDTAESLEAKVLSVSVIPIGLCTVITKGAWSTSL